MARARALLLLLLTACTTQPAWVPQPVPPWRVLDASALQASANALKVTVAVDAWREEGPPLRLFLDDRAVADLRPGEHLILFVAPGTHTLRVKKQGLVERSEAATEFAATDGTSFRTLAPVPGTLAIQPA